MSANNYMYDQSIHMFVKDSTFTDDWLIIIINYSCAGRALLNGCIRLGLYQYTMGRVKG